MAITLVQLCRAMPACPYTRAERLFPFLNASMDRAEINTPLRGAAYLTQLGHESMDLLYMKEIADGTKYEGRLDLGNTKSGDGKRFKGRGPIQITGRDNYTRFAAWSGLDCIIHPELLEEPENGFLASAWYWETRNLNDPADKGDILKVSIGVNGRNPKTGLPNGWEDRQARYKRALKAMGVAA